MFSQTGSLLTQLYRLTIYYHSGVWRYWLVPRTGRFLICFLRRKQRRRRRRRARRPRQQRKKLRRQPLRRVRQGQGGPASRHSSCINLGHVGVNNDAVNLAHLVASLKGSSQRLASPPTASTCHLPEQPYWAICGSSPHRQSLPATGLHVPGMTQRSTNRH